MTFAVSGPYQAWSDLYNNDELINIVWALQIREVAVRMRNF